MKSLRYARAFGAAFALVMLGAVSMAAVSPYWQSTTPGTQGPWLGDNNFNIFTLWRAFVTSSGYSFTSGLSVSQTATQVACTQLNTDGIQEVKTSAGTGSVCLPTAVAGKQIYIGNASGQTIDIFASNTPFTVGTADTINGTAGSSAYTGLTNGKNTDCFAAANGAWYCTSGN
jgi:hypothetical protein